MFKVALVEDESFVLKGMTMVLKREKEINLVGTATNGKEGLELIYREQPDIVLTDIRMPGITGLEMIERANQQFPDIIYIIFSGFNEFKYVQKAIGLGVLDYLEKPVTVPNLKHVLEKAKRIIEYKRNYQQMKERAQQVDRVMVEQALYKLLHEPAEREAECLSRLYDAGEFLQYSTEIAVLCVGKTVYKESEADIYRQIINAMTFSVVEEHNIDIFTLTIQENLFFIYFSQECELFPFYERMENEKRSLEEQGIVFYAGLGNICQSVYELKKAFGEARSALTYAEFLEESKIVKIEEVEFQNNIPLELTEGIHSLTFNFRLGNYSECRNQTSGYLDLMQESVMLPDILKHECLEILCLLQNLMIEAQIPSEYYKDASLHEEIEGFTSANEILNWARKKAEDMIQYSEAHNEKGEGNPVKIVKNYIDQHYSESITLELLAEQVHMNAAYLSVIFKRDEGISYSSYLLRVRMENAKILLEKGKKAKEVCEAVGYFDYRYFNKQFKNYTGMTPDTYKRSKI